MHVNSISNSGRRRPTAPVIAAGAPMSVAAFVERHNRDVISKARRAANTEALAFMNADGFGRISETVTKLHGEFRTGDVSLRLDASRWRDKIVAVVCTTPPGEALELVLHFPNDEMCWFDRWTLRAVQPDSDAANEFISELKTRVRRFFREALWGSTTGH